jgi:hypothetical protein
LLGAVFTDDDTKISPRIALLADRIFDHLDEMVDAVHTACQAGFTGLDSEFGEALRLHRSARRSDPGGDGFYFQAHRIQALGRLNGGDGGWHGPEDPDRRSLGALGAARRGYAAGPLLTNTCAQNRPLLTHSLVWRSWTTSDRLATHRRGSQLERARKRVSSGLCFELDSIGNAHDALRL